MKIIAIIGWVLFYITTAVWTGSTYHNKARINCWETAYFQDISVTVGWPVLVWVIPTFPNRCKVKNND